MFFGELLMTVFVKKFDGTYEIFNREKVIQTCIRMGATRDVAEIIVNKIESKIYNGIETKKILKMIFRFLSKYKPSAKHHIDLRRALSLLKSKPDFELFIQSLFKEHDYEVFKNQIIKGKCVEHEVDGIVKKNDKTYIIEVKHHFDYHTPIGLDVSRISRAVFEDVTEGFEFGLNKFRIDSSIIVSNTKLSGHARRYADCRGIKHMCWSSSHEYDLQNMIEEKKLYPITYLKGLKTTVREKLVSAEVIFLKDLIKKNPKTLSKEINVSLEIILSLTKRAEVILIES
jgi:hypothetical protein